MQIFYKNLCSKVIMLVVEASDTIESVRVKVKDPPPSSFWGLKTAVVAVKAVTAVKAVQLLEDLIGSCSSLLGPLISI